MKSFRKKVLALTLGASLLCVSAASAMAADDSAVQEQTLDEYLEFCIPKYITAQQIETDGTVQYSAPIDLYDFESNSIIGCEVFVIENNELIGKLNVYSSEDGYTSVFGTGITDDMEASYSDGEEIAFGFYEDSVWLYTENDGFVFVDGLYKGTPETAPAQLSKITASGSIEISTANNSRALGGILLDVEHVHNSETYDSDGQCSEACVAMVLNYHNDTYMSADSVCAVVNNNDESGVPYKALQFFKYDPVYADTALSADSVYNALAADKPIIASLRDSANTTRHAVVICGITIDGTSSTYTVDDPNCDEERKSFIITANPITVNSSIFYEYNPKYTTWYRYAY